MTRKRIPCSERWSDNKHAEKVTEYAGRASDAIQKVREAERAKSNGN